MRPNVKQKQPVVQAAINNALSGGGTGGTTDYTDLENKPSINSVTLTGNKTSYDLGIDEVPNVNNTDDNKFLKAIYDTEKQKGDYYWDTINQLPTIGQADNNKLLKANFNSGNPQAEWTTVNTVPTYDLQTDSDKVLAVNPFDGPTWTEVANLLNGATIGNNYIEFGNGQRLYVSSTEPSAYPPDDTIPNGALGIGWEPTNP